ncbi:MAG TPA: lytic transglycosylase domain-containing protein [Feifaniaceae bacterium]|nr:lytic transglycosylase domain-containing protein [Feifaniaceae bacterium]
METVRNIYFAKLEQVQSILDANAAKVGFTAPRFSKLLAGTLAAQTQTQIQPAAVQGASSYDGLIKSAAQENGLDEALIKAVIQAESGYRADAVSSAGAQGLMQLMPGTAASLGVTNSFDPAQNISGGTKYLKSLIDRFGDLRLALAAYNTGPSRIAGLNIADPDDASEYAKISERVRGYVSDVLSNYEAYGSQEGVVV